MTIKYTLTYRDEDGDIRTYTTTNPENIEGMIVIGSWMREHGHNNMYCMLSLTTEREN